MCHLQNADFQSNNCSQTFHDSRYQPVLILSSINDSIKKEVMKKNCYNCTGLSEFLLKTSNQKLTVIEARYKLVCLCNSSFFTPLNGFLLRDLLLILGKVLGTPPFKLHSETLCRIIPADPKVKPNPQLQTPRRVHLELNSQISRRIRKYNHPTIAQVFKKQRAVLERRDGD